MGVPNYGYCKNVQPLWLSRFLGHKWQTIIVALVLLVVPLYTGNPRDLAFSAGALLGLKVSPDLDLSWTRLGLFGKLSLADEYTKLIAHRARISHSLFLGTVVRVLVVFVPVVLFLVLPAMAVVSRYGLLLRMPWLDMVKVFSGLVWADNWHVVCDWLEGKLKMKGG